MKVGLLLLLVQCTVLVLEHNFALEAAIGSHACWLAASTRVTNIMPLARPLPLTVGTVNNATTLKACQIAGSIPEAGLER